ncbi:ABC transporter substrate-binding protein [Arthrobacter sp. SA17]
MDHATSRVTANNGGARQRSVLPKLVTALVVGALGAGLAACSAPATEASGEKTTIRFLYATGDETWNSVVKAVTDDFNAQSKTTTVQLDPLPPGTDYATAMKTMDATGNWPALVDMRETVTYADAGKLAPIPAEVTGLLKPEVYGTAKDGNVYTVPATALNGEIGINIVYDKDYFKEHSLEVPETYSDFISLMDKIKANGDVPLATAGQDIWPSDQLWKPLAAPTFAQRPDAGGFWNAVEAGDASIESLREPLERLKTITDNYVLKGWQSTADAQTTTLLVNHQTIMATSSAGIGRLNDIHKVNPNFNAGLFIIPADDGTINVLKNSVNGETATGIAISSQAKEDGAQYDSAIEFLKYYFSLPTANLVEKTGMIAPNIMKAEEVERNTSIPGAEDYFALLNNPKLKWYENSPTAPSFSAFMTFFRQARIEMQDGQTTIDQAIEKSLSEYKSRVKGD